MNPIGLRKSVSHYAKLQQQLIQKNKRKSGTENLDNPNVKILRSTANTTSTTAPARVFSNDMSDCCKHKCHICGKGVALTGMRMQELQWDVHQGLCWEVWQLPHSDHQGGLPQVRDLPVGALAWRGRVAQALPQAQYADVRIQCKIYQFMHKTIWKKSKEKYWGQ